MIKFKEFIKKIEPGLIPVVPAHGKHSRVSNEEVNIDPLLIPVVPCHGSHSCAENKLRAEATFHDDDDESHDVHSRYDHDEYLMHPHNKHIGDTPTQVHNKLDMHSKKFDKHPGSKHVFEYTSSSRNINHNLLAKQTGKPKSWHMPDWDGEKSKEQKQRERKEHYTRVAGIDRALKKSKLEHDVHVFHGTKEWNPGELAAKHPKGHIKSAAYLSTSVDPRTAHSFAGGKHEDVPNKHILHIHMKKGQHGLYVGRNSAYYTEKEMLLPRNTTLKVHPIPHKLKCGTHVWKAHVVDHDDDKK